jgi:NitT/TauT family transport system substrate-binding protein
VPLTRRASLGALSAAAMALAALPARSQRLATVRVAASLDDGLTPLLYGMHAGIFTRLGLDIQLQPAASGGALAAAVAGGAVDVGKSSLMALITAHARGVAFRIVAGAAQYSAESPTTELVVLRTSPVKTVADTNGKTVAVSALGSLDMLGTELYVDQRGGNSSALKFIEMPLAAMLPALESGRADLAAIVNPTLAAALGSGNVRVFAAPYDAIGRHFLLAAWFAMQEFVGKNPDVVQRFSEGIYRSAAYTNAHHAETVPILAAYSHIEPDVIAKMNRQNNATAVDPNDVQPAIDVAVRYKVIETGFPAREFLV